MQRTSDIVFGKHAVESLLEREPARIERIWIAEQVTIKGQLMRQIQAAKKRGARVQRVDKRALARLTDGGNHQGVAAQAAVVEMLLLKEWFTQFDSDLSQNRLVIAFEGIRDPGNLGAIYRSAAAAGVAGMLLPRRGTAPLSGVALKRSAGTLSSVPTVKIGNLAQTMELFKKRGYMVVGLSEKGSSVLGQVELPLRMLLIVGSEDTGMRRLHIENSDFNVAIPMTGPAGSLNVSCAVSVILYDYIRQLQS